MNTEASDKGVDTQSYSDRASVIIGDVVRLMLALPTHKHMNLTDIVQRIVPAISLNQFRVLHKDDMPLAYLSWAKLSDDVEKGLRNTPLSLNPMDWSSGDNLWIVDRIAPSRVAEQALDDLEQNLFGDKARRQVSEDVPATKIARRDGQRAAANLGSVQIRMAETEADLEILADMVESFHRESDPQGKKVNRSDQLQGWRRQWRENSGKYGILIAELNGQAIGVLVAQIGNHSFSATTAAQCLGLYVHPDHRGGFAAVKLLQGFRRWAEEHRLETLTLHVTSGVGAARTDRLFRRLGFAQTGGNYQMTLGNP